MLRIIEKYQVFGVRQFGVEIEETNEDTPKLKSNTIRCVSKSFEWRNRGSFRIPICLDTCRIRFAAVPAAVLIRRWMR